MTKNQVRNYLIYARKSDESGDKQKNSVAYQVKECLRYAKQHKLTLAEQTIPGFVEEGIIRERHSAFKTQKIKVQSNGRIQYQIARPKFQQLVHLLNQKKLKGVIVLCWDRISRNEQDGMLVKQLIDSGVDIRFVWVEYSQSSSGHLHMDIDGMFAAHYSRVISEKVRASNEKIRAEGKCLYTAPLGYLDQGSSNKPLDPERAHLVKRLFELYVTGEWSIVQLTHWAHEQGLTSKPMRPKRTREEILQGADNQKDKICRPVGRVTIHSILRNPFYIGKIRNNGSFSEGNHQPLIDVALFNRVQRLLAQRCRTVHYTDQEFFRYRGLIRCSCGRSYSPYVKKGHTYYRARCHEDCLNPQPNLLEEEIDSAISRFLEDLPISDEDCQSIEARLLQNQDQIADKLQTERADRERRRIRIQEDLEYLRDHKVTLLRSDAYSPEEYRQECERLESNLSEIERELELPADLIAEIHHQAISTSELLKNARLWFDLALDKEKHGIVISVFSELVFKDRELAQVSLKKGFAALQKWRDVLSCSQGLQVSELASIYLDISAIVEEYRESQILGPPLNTSGRVESTKETKAFRRTVTYLVD